MDSAVAPCDFICAQLASRGRGGERAADPLHRTRINAKTLGNLADTFTSALALVQCGQDSFLKLGGYPRPAKSFALVLGPSKASADCSAIIAPQLRRVPKQIVNPDS